MAKGEAGLSAGPVASVLSNPTTSCPDCHSFEGRCLELVESES